jgi:2,4-dienoyl-CoA reductase-like NADH-dependent reductase (Old Yellow Enzyme family)
MIKAAMTECLADPATNLPNEAHFNLYKAWSLGGIGAQITGNVMVDRRYMEAPGNVGLEAHDSAPERFALYERYAAAIKTPRPNQEPAVAIMQISHVGRQCPMSVSTTPIAPSPLQLALPGMPAFLSPVGKPREMTAADITEVKQRFVDTATLAVKAGFDGVQVHAAHGYLLSQFLSPKTNFRTDDYGGNAQNRRRLLLEIVRGIRSSIGPNKVVSVKLNSADFDKAGFSEAESIAVVEELTKLKVDLIEVSGGTYEVSTSTRQKE